MPSLKRKTKPESKPAKCITWVNKPKKGLVGWNVKTMWKGDVRQQFFGVGTHGGKRASYAEAEVFLKTPKRSAPQKSPAPLTDAPILPSEIVAVLRIQVTALESLLRKHNADLAAHTRAIAAAVEPIASVLDAAGKMRTDQAQRLALTKRRSRKQKE